MSLAVESLTDPAAFARVQQEWDDLLERAHRTEPFLSHRWLTAWFRHFLGDDGLHVLVVKDGERWVGALPLIKVTSTWRGMRIRTLRFPVSQESANLRADLVVTEPAHEAARALVAYLERHAGEWERWQLDGLVAGTPGFAALQQAVRASTLRTTTWQLDQEIYFLRLEGTWEMYLAARGHNFRKNLRHAWNRLARSGGAARIRTCRRRDELETGLAALIGLDARSTKATRAGAILVAGPVAEFYRSLVAAFADECRIDFLEVDDVPVASLFTLYTRGTAFLVHNAYSPNAAGVAPGRHLLAHLLVQAREDGLSEIDFNGRTRFVQTWSETARAVLRCTAYSAGHRSRLAFWRDEILAPSRRRASRGIPSCPLTPAPLVHRTSANAACGTLPRAFRDRSVEYYEDGRTALACGLDALPLAPGDEVLFPSYHCGSEFEVLTAKGLTLRYYATPVRLDVDVALLEREATPQTRAVYVIHYLGRPQNVGPIAAFCRARGLILIEDCAQALYSGTEARPVGLLADLAIFSLHKFLPLPDGGAAVMRRPLVLPRGNAVGIRQGVMLKLRSSAVVMRHAAGRAAALAHIGACFLETVWHRAGLAPPSRRRAISDAARRRFLATDHPAAIARRARNYRRLHGLFANLAGVEPWLDHEEEGFVPLAFALWADNPAPLLDALEAAGIDAGLHWSALDGRFPIDRFPEVIRLKAHLVVIPTHQDMSEDDHRRLAEAVATLGYLPRPDPGSQRSKESRPARHAI